MKPIQNQFIYSRDAALGRMSPAQRWSASVMQAAGFPIPRHVAIIMDGNRRWGRSRDLSLSLAYNAMIETFRSVLGWCEALAIQEVSIYAFSIENFKRSRDEVSLVLALYEQELTNMLDSVDQLREWEMCVHFPGNLRYLPAGLQEVAARLSLATQHGTNFKLNFCMAYTSRDELAHVTRQLIDSRLVTAAALASESLVDHLTYVKTESAAMASADLLLRTSGEQRFSDYFLWQSAWSALHFVPIKFPELTFWHLALAVIEYQVHLGSIDAARDQYTKSFAWNPMDVAMLDLIKSRPKMAADKYRESCIAGSAVQESIPESE